MSTHSKEVVQPIKLSMMEKVRGESRKVVDTHAGAEERTAVRMVRVETGGVDRVTGEPLKVFYEVTAKVPGREEVTRVYAGKGAERNAELVFLAAQHGVVNLSTPLYELPRKLWKAYRDEGAFDYLIEHLPEGFWLWGIRPLCWPTPVGLQPRPELTEHMAKLGRVETGTRINSGDSHADLASGQEDGQTGIPGPGSLFREVPVEELQAEETAVQAATRPPVRPTIPPERYPLHGPIPGPFGRLRDVYHPAQKGDAA